MDRTEKHFGVCGVFYFVGSAHSPSQYCTEIDKATTSPGVWSPANFCSLGHVEQVRGNCGCHLPWSNCSFAEKLNVSQPRISSNCGCLDIKPFLSSCTFNQKPACQVNGWHWPKVSRCNSDHFSPSTCTGEQISIDIDMTDMTNMTNMTNRRGSANVLPSGTMPLQNCLATI